MSKFLSGLFGSLMKHSTPLEKALKNTCFLKDTFDEIDYDDLLKVLQFLSGKSEVKQADAITQFFAYLKDQNDLSLQRRLKILALIHKCIKKIGFEFAEEFLVSKPTQLREKVNQSQSKNTKTKQIVFHYMDIESWLEEYLIKHYYDYLMRMSLNLETYKTCLQANEKESGTTKNTTSNGVLNTAGIQTNQQILTQGKQDKFQQGNNNNNIKQGESLSHFIIQQQNSPTQSQMLQSQGSAHNALKIIILFKVNNLVNFVIKLQKQFYIVFTEFKFISVVKDIAYMILKDCVTYYNYMHRQIMLMVTNYEAMLENDQMQFYELFIELIKLNSALHDFGKLRKFFDEEESIDQPLILNITKERARQIDRNHRKIVLKNEEVQRDRKLKLQQQMQGKAEGSDKGVQSATHNKKLSFFPKQGSMTSRVTSWKPNEQICEVTNDDEDEDIKTKFRINPKFQLLSQQQQFASGGNTNLPQGLPALNLQHLYGLQSEDTGKVGGGFNTDRVTYSRNFQEDEKSEKSESTKDTFNKIEGKKESP